MKAVITAGGAPPPPDLLRARCAHSDLVIAADRGVEVLLAAGLTPDLLIGDLDSAAPQSVALCCAETQRAPREKNETDLELAARTALSYGARDICILGATGGRVDHLLGNLAVLLWLHGQGAKAVIEDAQQTIRVVCGSARLVGEPGQTVSIVPAGQPATVTASGMRYPLDRLTLRPDQARGVSNVLLGQQAQIETDAPVFVISNKQT